MHHTLRRCLSLASVLNISRRILLVLLLALVVLPLESCRKKKSGDGWQFDTDDEPVSKWEGKYAFDEYGGGDVGEMNPTPIFVSHKISVYSRGDSLMAFLSASGFETSVGMHCATQVVGDTLHLSFARYADDYAGERTLKPKTPLLSLTRKDYTLLTHWREYSPKFIGQITSAQQHRVYFMREQEEIPGINPPNFEEYWSEYQSALTKNDSVKVAYMTLFPLVGSNYVRPEGSLTDLVSKTDFMTNYHLVLFPSLRKAIANKKASDFVKNKKTEDDNTIIPNGLVAEGSDMFRVLISSKELQQFDQQNTSAEKQEMENALKQKPNKILNNLTREYKWALFVAMVNKKYRVCYMGIATWENKNQ